MSKQPVIAGIDGGSTKTRVQVRCAERLSLISEAEVSQSTNLYQYNAEGPDAVATLLDALLGRCLEPSHTLEAAVLATAGIDAQGDAERHLSACLRSRHLRALGSRLRVCSDVEPIDACGTLDHRVCVIAGTGSSTLAVHRRDGRVVARHQVGGLDLALSDAGSAAWIGHHAMRAALQDLQQVRASTLGAAMLEHFELPTDTHEPWRALRAVRLQVNKADLASLTKEVVVPQSAHDAVARQLLLDAGEALATDILAAARAIAAPPLLEVLAVGGVWSSNTVTARATQRVVEAHPNATVRRVDPAKGAATLAYQLLAST